MRFLLLVSLLCSAALVSAQHTITGRVVDAAGQAPLAFVPLGLEGGRTGATTDIDGRFTLVVPALPAVIKLSYVGYETQLVTVTDGAPLVVLLKQSNTQLKVVEVLPTENPAHRIIRRVQAGRKENDGMRYRSYRYRSYSKTIFTAKADTAAGDTGRTATALIDEAPLATADTARTAARDTTDEDINALLSRQHLFLLESATKKSFIPPAAEKEEVLAMRVSGLKDPMFLTLAAQTKTFSIYEPQITLSDKNYLGPLGPSGTNKYFFHLEDTLYQGADSVYVISYRPRRGTRFDGLKGLLYVNTDGYAVQNVTAEAAERAGGLSVRFQQKHERIGGKAWFPVQLNTFIYFDNVSVNGLAFYGEGRTYLKDIEVDADVQRKEVRGPEFVADQLSIRRDDAFWNGLRTDSLDSKDLMTYQVLDSIGEKERFDHWMKVISALTTGRIPVGPVDLLVDRFLAYNAYEGLRLGAGVATNDRVTRYGSLGGYFAYGFKDQRWKYGGDLTLKPLYGRDAHVKFSYENDVSEIGGVSFKGKSRTFSPDSYRLLFVDRMDRMERFAGEVMLRAGSSTKFWLGTERALRVNDIGYRYVQPEAEGVTRLRNDFLTGAVTFGVRWAFHERLARLPDRELSLGTKFPVVYLSGMRAIKGLWDGEWDTWRVDAMIEKVFRIRLLGDLSVRVLGGVADASAPMAFLYDLRGTNADPKLAASNVFETMRPNEFLADRYVTFHVRHSFGALLVRTKYFRPRPSIVSSAGFGDLSEPGNHRGLDFRPLHQGFYESGLVIDNLLRSKTSSLGVAAFYRYGPYAFTDPADNLVLKLTAGYAF